MSERDKIIMMMGELDVTIVRVITTAGGMALNCVGVKPCQCTSEYSFVIDIITYAYTRLVPYK